jgi:hypothetical protein
MTTVIDKRQTATIIAALRFWQSNEMAFPSPLPMYLAEFASDEGRVQSLNAVEVDTLCAALQSPDFRSESYRPKAVILHETGDMEVLADPEVEIERIATNNIRYLVDTRPRELRGVLGDNFKHLVSIPKQAW